ncbi:regulatory protein RecX [Croceibacterium ferulae]|uniref:regulatory protein RecX n=1 Tax=Croceibacterium ferulae TaxID=1854641 RepID=UPI000EB3FC28|nr:RecX family transcriptional regulator [Croceibacterium ferulae]
MQGDEPGDPQAQTGRRRIPPPLDRTRLEDLALAYVARFATSAGKLERYLTRKLRERGWSGEGQPPVAAIIVRHVELGYIDDAGFARARAGSLLRRGYGPRRIGQVLGEAGIAEPIRHDVRPDGPARRQAALALARKRRFGPFGGKVAADPALRQKQIAAMLRAGHMLAEVRGVIDAPSTAVAEGWAAAADDDD